jgi:prepilin-type N-terminal cleavage/methylation domain-containing protein
VFERYREIQKRRESGDASEFGFTLIELLIVIVVLGILAAIVVFSLTGVSGQSKEAACTSDAKSVEIAADAYQAKTGAFPTELSVLVPSYLHSLPSSPNYTITLGTGAQAGDIMYANGTTGTPQVFADASGCAGVS